MSEPRILRGGCQNYGSRGWMAEKLNRIAILYDTFPTLTPSKKCKVLRVPKWHQIKILPTQVICYFSQDFSKYQYIMMFIYTLI